MSSTTKGKKLPQLRATRINGAASHVALVNDFTGGLIADVYYDYAEEIATACNSHEALLSALESALAEIDFEIEQRASGAHTSMQSLRKESAKARAAIGRAKGEKA